MPTIATMADPNSAIVAEGAVVGEGIIDPRVCLAQTFMVSPTATMLKLDKIAIWEDGSAPTQNPYTLRLVDLGTADPTYQGGGSQEYAAGTDMWGGSVTLTYYGTASRSARELDFEGAEEVMLTAGHYYAFELTAASPIGGLWWYRGIPAGSTYTDGAAFIDTLHDTPGTRNQMYKDSNGRDFAMAVYLIPEPATIVLLSLGSLALFGKRGRITNRNENKRGKGKYPMRKLVVCVMLVAFSMPVYASAKATTVIGDWENGSSDGWIDWIEYGNGLSITAPENASKYGFSAIGATSGSKSLRVTQSGWGQNLAIKLQDNGLVNAFLANKVFQIDVTYPTTSIAGWQELWEVSLNAERYGWNSLSANPVPDSHADYGSGGGPQRSFTLSFDYTAALSKISSNPWYVEFIISTNSDADHGVFYFDNARLVDNAQIVPEPATVALLALGSLALLRKRGR
jgi:hypothetical protein